MRAVFVAALVLAIWMAAATSAHTLLKSPDGNHLFRMVQLQTEENLDLKQPKQEQKEKFENRAKRVAVPWRMPQVASLEAAAARAASGAGRILYGKEALQCQFPFVVALLNNLNQFCTASLISSRWVLTAAHCVAEASWLAVFVGDVEWQNAPYVFATRVFIHGEYDDYWLHNDVALVDLGGNLATNDCLEPVVLETDGCYDTSLDNITAIAMGWGLTSDDAIYIEDKLRWVKTNTISNDECRRWYGGTILDSTLCTLPITGANGTICSGDSGGPLLAKSTRRQIGVNSFVSIYGCQSGWPNGYARVPCFVKWIEYVMTL